MDLIQWKWMDELGVQLQLLKHIAWPNTACQWFLVFLFACTLKWWNDFWNQTSKLAHISTSIFKFICATGVLIPCAFLVLLRIGRLFSLNDGEYRILHGRIIVNPGGEWIVLTRKMKNAIQNCVCERDLENHEFHQNNVNEIQAYCIFLFSSMLFFFFLFLYFFISWRLFQEVQYKTARGCSFRINLESLSVIFKENTTIFQHFRTKKHNKITQNSFFFLHVVILSGKIAKHPTKLSLSTEMSKSRRF